MNSHLSAFYVLPRMLDIFMKCLEFSARFVCIELPILSVND